MSCIFCQIVTSSASAQVVHKDEHTTAFLDTRPVFKGHVLVVPNPHLATLSDLPSEQIAIFFSAVQRVARAVEAGMGAEGTFVAINNRVSQSVPHLHAHVVPRKKGDGLKGFFWPRTKYASPEEAAEVAKKIAERM
jgi:histidine triad (HIT) family protein